jgi:D-beta-D-heptose 7-phosphate kinase/D-beta-D-heptose 1-phosphate adenosyltransferase
MDTLLAALSEWKPFNAIVVGDFMLDQLLKGSATRLSPDAPVPVLHVKEQQSQPGGAANLTLDLLALHGRVSVLGVTGNDPESQILRDALAQSGVDCAGLIADDTRPTTVKRNLIGLAQGRHAQKMFRVDFESNEPIGDKVESQILSAFDAALKDADVVCIEDYNKGVCTPSLCHQIIERAKAAGVPVLVDPAPIKDYAKYKGATAITPNRTEAELATGINAPEDARAAHREHLALLAEDETVADRAIGLGPGARGLGHGPHLIVAADREGLLEGRVDGHDDARHRVGPALPQALSEHRAHLLGGPNLDQVHQVEGDLLVVP